MEALKELEWLQKHGIDVKSVEEMEKLEAVNLSHKGLTISPELEHLKNLQDKLTAKEVFSIENMEIRRVAYERMDKSKMLELDNYKVIDEGIDDKGNPHRIISFEIDGYEEPFKYYHCKCASSDREYFVGTDKDTVWEAKAHSFGLDTNVEWVKEW